MSKLSSRILSIKILDAVSTGVTCRLTKMCLHRFYSYKAMMHRLVYREMSNPEQSCETHLPVCHVYSTSPN